MTGKSKYSYFLYTVIQMDIAWSLVTWYIFGSSFSDVIFFLTILPGLKPWDSQLPIEAFSMILALLLATQRVSVSYPQGCPQCYPLKDFCFRYRLCCSKSLRCYSRCHSCWVESSTHCLALVINRSLASTNDTKKPLLRRLIYLLAPLFHSQVYREKIRHWYQQLQSSQGCRVSVLFARRRTYFSIL